MAHQLGVAPDTAGISVLLPLRRLSSQRRHPRTSRRHEKTLRETKNELLFHSMILVPHQIEVIFVICTLLSGRRKLYLQDALLELGLPQVLDRMFHRMSWEVSPQQTEMSMDGTAGGISLPQPPQQHIHGPSCECNPESALRVQYLRLVHNFYDRDFVQSAIKQRLLSSYEKSCIASLDLNMSKVDEIFIPPESRGLLSLLMNILTKESVDSIYRFWLSSCVEAFLRGSQPSEQLFVVQTGLMKFLVASIMTSASSFSSNGSGNKVSRNNLQTAFDLLGELVKNNPRCLAILDGCFASSSSWNTFASLLLSNLIDSNVFIRSLYLTLDSQELLQSSNSDRSLRLGTTKRRRGGKERRLGYCSHSWVQREPTELSLVQDNSCVHQAFIATRELAMRQAYKEEDEKGEEEKDSKRISPFGYERIADHLRELKEEVLLRLMSAVSLHSINHETICCVNSALIILLGEQRNERLPCCIHRLRQLSSRSASSSEGRMNGFKHPPFPSENRTCKRLPHYILDYAIILLLRCR